MQTDAQTHTTVVDAFAARLRQGMADGTVAKCGRRVRVSRVALLLVLAAGFAALGAIRRPVAARSAPAGACGFLRPQQPPAVYRHVITIVLEHHSFAEIAGRIPVRTGLRGVRARRQLLGDHASEPSELPCVTSGGTAGITNDCTDCSVSTSSIFGQVGSRGWRATRIDASNRFTGSRAGNYAKKHNPAAYFTKSPVRTL